MEGKLVARTMARLAERDSLDAYARQRLLEMLEAFEQHFDGLGFCLSEERDLLSQWRGYAADGTGVAIGFSKEYLEWLSLHFQSSNAPGFSPHKVQYDPAAHEAEVEPTYREARKLIDQGAFHHSGFRGLLDSRTDEEVEIDRKANESMFRSLSITLLHLLPKLYLLKSKAFREEQEWRLLSHLVRGADDKCFYRATGDRIIPFRQFELVEPDRKPLAEIILGPKHISPIPQVEEFLRQCGFESVTVLRSDATYR